MNENPNDFFDHRRYRTNKILLSLLGQWPYQQRHTKVFFIIFIFSYSATIWIVQLRKVIIERRNSELLIEALPGIIVHIGSMVKAINFIINADKLDYLLKHIKYDWNLPMGPEEKILARYSDDGRKFSIVYAGVLYSSMCVFIAVPLAPKIIVACGLANFSSPVQFAVPVDYFIDSEDNFVYIQIHLCTGIFFVITVYVACDIMFVVLIQHASGIFSVVGYRLEHLTDSDDLDIYLHPPCKNDKAYKTVIECIKKHKEVIRFTNKLDGMYAGSFFLMIMINVPVMSFTALQVVWGIDKPAEAFRQGLLTVSELLHLFFECYFSQRLTDHSLKIYESLKQMPWYTTSIRTRKLLNFMVMKSMTPAVLRAGHVYAMSMENFSSIVRTSMSYFTILLSTE